MNSNVFEGYCVKCKSKQMAVNAMATVAQNGQNMLKGNCSQCGCTVPKMIPGRNLAMQAAFTEQRREAGVTNKTKRTKRSASSATSAAMASSGSKAGTKGKMTRKQRATAVYGPAPSMYSHGGAKPMFFGEDYDDEDVGDDFFG